MKSGHKCAPRQRTEASSQTGCREEKPAAIAPTLDFSRENGTNIQAVPKRALLCGECYENVYT
jgi:hypothetical protein